MSEPEQGLPEHEVKATFRMHHAALENIRFLAVARCVSANTVVAQAVASEMMIASLVARECKIEAVHPNGDRQEIVFDPQQALAEQDCNPEDILPPEQR